MARDSFIDKLGQSWDVVDNYLDNEAPAWANMATYMLPVVGTARGFQDAFQNFDEGNIGQGILDLGLSALSIIPGIGTIGSGLGRAAKLAAKGAKLIGRDTKGVGKALQAFNKADNAADAAEAVKAAKGAKSEDGFFQTISKQQKKEAEDLFNSNQLSKDAYRKQFEAGGARDVIPGLQKAADAEAAASRDTAIKSALQKMDEAATKAGHPTPFNSPELGQVGFEAYGLSTPERLAKITGQFKPELAQKGITDDLMKELEDAVAKSTKGTVDQTKIKQAIDNLVKDYNVPKYEGDAGKVADFLGGVTDYWDEVGLIGNLLRRGVRGGLLDYLNPGYYNGEGQSEGW